MMPCKPREAARHLSHDSLKMKFSKGLAESPTAYRKVSLCPHCLPHRVSAAFLATALRPLADKISARALPRLNASEET